MGYIIVLVFIALISRLFWLQFIHGQEFRNQADKNRIRLMPITAPRGTFYDRNGNLLATSRPGFTVSLVPISGPIADDVIVKLAAILDTSPDTIRKKISQQDNPLEPIRIRNDVGPEIISQIEERHDELPGVVLEVQAVRNYIYNELGAHMFGYVGEISDDELEQKKQAGYKQGDQVGKFGLEKYYDKELRGQDGGSQIEVDVTGRPQQMLGKKEPVRGSSLVLTIDAKIQKAAEQAMDNQLAFLQDKYGNINAKAAAAVVLDPRTGEVLAMVSRPTFNPNLFNGGISAKDWKLINDNPYNPMLNRAIGSSYPPGSSFKIVTGSAALDLGKVTPEEKILDTGTHFRSRARAASVSGDGSRVPVGDRPRGPRAVPTRRRPRSPLGGRVRGRRVECDRPLLRLPRNAGRALGDRGGRPERSSWRSRRPLLRRLDRGASRDSHDAAAGRGRTDPAHAFGLGGAGLSRRRPRARGPRRGGSRALLAGLRR
jgi:penicillin-binding protein 2